MEPVILHSGFVYVANAPQGSSSVGPHDLWRVDPVQFAASRVGSLGLNLQSLDFGPDGRLYSWDPISTTNGPGWRGLGLLRIDTATAPSRTWRRRSTA